MKKNPILIDPCPIIDSVVEIRFIPSVYPSAVFGIAYNLLKGDFPQVEKLPIMQLPEPIRENDPAYKFKPHYKISNKKYTVQIGSNVLIIGSYVPYEGWSTFSKTIFETLNKFFNGGIVESVSRLGFRVINFFEEEDIFNKVKIQLYLWEKSPHKPVNTLIKTELENNSFKNTLQISNDIYWDNKGEKTPGSIIDIDTFKEYDVNFNFLTKYESEINAVHIIEKELFFSLLNEEFLKSLNPKYDE